MVFLPLTSSNFCFRAATPYVEHKGSRESELQAEGSNDGYV